MHRTLLGTTALLSTIMMAYPALAQSQGEGAATGAPTTGLEEIVVTAQRKTESSQRAAIALDVVSATALQNAGVVSSATLNAAVPSLYISKAGGTNTSYFIRGVGNFSNNGYTDPAVAFNVDGVYYGRPGSTIGAFYDLERIEVLKGPQGTLYGRNATGGAVNVLPAKPVPGQFSAKASLGYGNYNAIDAEAAVNIPLGPDGALRVSGKLVDRDGYNDDGTSDEKGHALRVQMLANLTDTLSVRVSGDYSHVGGMGVGGSYSQVINVTPGSPQTATSPANYTVVATNLDPRSGLLSPAGSAFFAGRVLGGPSIHPGPLAVPFLNSNFYGANAEIIWKTGIGTVTVIPAFRSAESRTLFNGPAFRGGLTSENYEQSSLEARVNGRRIGPVDWLVGGFYFNENVKGMQNFDQYTVNSFQNFNSKNNSWAVFGRLTLNATSRLRIVAGARFTEDNKKFTGSGLNLIETCSNSAGCIGGPSVPVALTYTDLAQMISVPTLPGPANSVAFGSTGNRLFYSPIAINQRIARNRVTWRGAAEYDVGPQSLLYASYETSFRSGGFNFSLGHETYEPEYIKAWTIGMKNRFFDNRFQLNLELFHWNYTNQQVAHFGLDSTGGNSFFTENIGSSRIQGADVDIQFRATPSTLLRGSVQILDNKLTSFVYNTQRNTTNNALPPIVGCPTSAGTAPIPGSTTGATGTVWVVNCSGKDGYNSPKLAFNAGVEQTFEMGDFNLVATVDGRYRSNRVTSFEFLSFQNSGSDFTADASLRFGPRKGNWSLTAYMQNIGNRLIPTLSSFAGTTGNVVVTNYAPPRTYGLKASVSF